MSLKVPSYTTPIPNKEEELKNLAFKVVEKDIEILIKDAQLLVEIGKVKEATLKYKAVQYNYMIINYLWLVRLWLFRKKYLPNNCNIYNAESKFKVTCIERNLACISTKLNTNLTKTFNKVLVIFELCRDNSIIKGEFEDNEFRKPGFVD